MKEIGRVKRAAGLKSLDELNVSSATRVRLERNFGSVGKAVHKGRCLAFRLAEFSGRTNYLSVRWQRELVSALKETGFIRPSSDFTATFNIGILYETVFFRRIEKSAVPVDIEGLSNEQYENFRGLTTVQIEEISNSIRTCLSEQEYAIISWHFGLNGNTRKNLEETADHFDVSCEDVRRIETMALRRLETKGKMDVFFPTILETLS